MARGRGKVKYKDVVKGKQKQRKNDRSVRKRKTHSSRKTEMTKSDFKKRKYYNADDKYVKAKRARIEPIVEQIQKQKNAELEEEEDDPLTQVRQLLGISSKSKAIDSDYDSSDEEKSDIQEENDDLEDGDLENNLDAEETSDDESAEEEEEDIESISKKERGSKERLDSNEGIEGNSQLADESERENEDISINEIELDLEIENEERNIENSNDPFVKHIHYDLHDSLLDSLQAVPMKVDVHTKNWPRLGELHIQIPQGEDQQVKETKDFGVLEKKTFAPTGNVPSRIEPDVKPESIMIKSQIIGNLRKANQALLNKHSNRIFTQLQSELFSIVNNYQDLCFSERTFSNAEEIRFIYCLHAVNHILKTRTKVLHHNAKLSSKEDVPEEFRDQGLVRPKILFIVPFRDAAYKIVSMLTDILFLEDKGNVINKKRFIEDYTGNELVMPKKNPKPEDYEMLFSGNTGDDFRIGMTVTKKSLKLYANFYSSDIIIASPLGLRTIIGAEGEPERDYDFLASIELLILDQTEIFLMQNWDHIIHIFNHLHMQPKDTHGTDIFRIRMWSLNGWSKYYRQTLIFSSVIMPEIVSIFNKQCFNYAGKVRVVNEIEYGAVTQVVVQVPHVFEKFTASNIQEMFDERFNFFIHKILPKHRDVLMKQTLIYIPSYFDFVRVRNYFKKEDIGFVQICEYSKEGKVARARDMFFHGDVPFLLYTERFHFFNRARIKGIRHIIFYQPPSFPHFYYEMCNLMLEANMNKKIGSMSYMTVSVIYSKYDAYQLSGIVGTEKAAQMIQSEKSVHTMVTGGS